MFLKADTTGRANKQFAATASTDIFVTVTYTEDTSVQPGTYFIKNPENGKVLDVAASTLTPPPAAGTLIKIRSLHGNTNQQWRIESAGAGMYTLTTISNTGTRLAISSNTDGTPAKTAASNTGDSQKFRIIKNKDGSYRIMPALSATRGLDIYHGSDPDKYARNIELFTYSGGSAGWNQKWTFEKVDAGDYVAYVENQLVWVTEVGTNLAVSRMPVYISVTVYFNKTGNVKTIKAIHSMFSLTSVPSLLYGPCTLQHSPDLIDGSTSGITGNYLATSGRYDSTQFFIYESTCSRNVGTASTTVTVRGIADDPQVDGFIPGLPELSIIIP